MILRPANMIDTRRKHLDAFRKISDSKERLPALRLHISEHPTVNYSEFSGTCFTKYDYTYYMLFIKTKTLYHSLHPDIQFEYSKRLQAVLILLKKYSLPGYCV